MRRDWRGARDARHHAGGIDGNRRRRQDEVNHAGHVAGGPMVATRHGRAGDRATGVGRHGTVLHVPAANRHAAVAANPAQQGHHQQDQHQGLAPASWTGRDQTRGTTEMRFTRRTPGYISSIQCITAVSAVIRSGRQLAPAVGACRGRNGVLAGRNACPTNFFAKAGKRFPVAVGQTILSAWILNPWQAGMPAPRRRAGPRDWPLPSVPLGLRLHGLPRGGSLLGQCVAGPGEGDVENGQEE